MALVEGLIVVTALRMPTNSEHMGGVIGSRKAEVAWTLLPSALLILLAVVTFRSLQGRG
jgi:heme/copper-type cytochrome/quinol oxidase subunit 2